LNYYYWKGATNESGNAYAETEKEAVEKLERTFHVKVVKIELLEADVFKNRFTGEEYKN
jgi:hypothetical protein